ncbi:MAG: prepilin-type N-terminal cleavage/methylation domain-containing protein [Patescibacteria group bacterium]
MKQKGFTLIELLVVIAIIGLLSSLAIISLNSARNKAYDAQVKSDLVQVRNSAEIYYDTNGSYTGFTVPTQLVAPNCSDDAAYVVTISADGTAYASWADLCADTDNDYCVDSVGVSKVTAGHVADGATACP